MNHSQRIMFATIASVLAATPAFAGLTLQSNNLDNIVRTRADLSTFRGFTETVGAHEPLRLSGSNGKGYTIFVPSNAAFAKLPPQVMEEFRQNRPLMEKVMKFHMVSGRWPASGISGATTLSTLQGEKLVVAKQGRRVTIGESWVTESLSGSNGEIHVIDRVLLPPSIRDHFIRRAILPLNDARAAALGERMNAQRQRDAEFERTRWTRKTPTQVGRPGRLANPVRAENLMELATSTSDLSTFHRLATEAGIGNTLMDGTYTVFAPTNAAFDQLPRMAMDAFVADRELLKQVLMYHVVRGEITSNKLRRSTVRTAGGSSVRVKVGSRGAAKVNDAVVLETDLLARNGAIHTINKVLVPPAVVRALRIKGITVEY